ncbi:MAG: acyl-ACP--UDP-N-acetylglucosamine O-acyltransferase [Betaproteobacteria bacterium]
MARVHASAIVDPAAQLAEDVEIGPFCLIGPQVSIGAGTRLDSHVVVSGRTHIGRNNRFHAHSAIGGAPQDKKYGGEDTELVIGDGNTVREHCTFSLGTVQGGGVTRLGSGNWIMANVHVAHDCRVGDHTIMANNVTLAGHVEIGDQVILGGMSAVHQFTRVGAHAMVAGGAIVLRDVPPYVMCSGNPAEPHGLNTEGLRRRGFDADTLAALKRAYRVLYREGRTVAEAQDGLAALEAEAPAAAAAVALLRDFVAASARGLIR